MVSIIVTENISIQHPGPTFFSKTYGNLLTVELTNQDNPSENGSYTWNGEESPMTPVGTPSIIPTSTSDTTE